MQYVIERLEEMLKHELRARSSALSVTEGSVGHYHAPPPLPKNMTQLAFEESLRLANERIPQLHRAIEMLKAEKTPVNAEEFTVGQLLNFNVFGKKISGTFKENIK